MYFTKDYLKKSKKEQEEILLKACEETQKAEEYLKKRLRIDRFSGMEFFNAYKKEKDIIVQLGAVKLKIRNAEKIECDGYEYEKIWLNKSQIYAGELGYKNGKFELRFVVENQEKDFYFLSIKGKGIEEMGGSDDKEE